MTTRTAEELATVKYRCKGGDFDDPKCRLVSLMSSNNDELSPTVRDRIRNVKEYRPSTLGFVVVNLFVRFFFSPSVSDTFVDTCIFVLFYEYLHESVTTVQ